MKSMTNFFLNPSEFFLIVYPGLQSIDSNFYSQCMQKCKIIKSRKKFEDSEEFMLENTMLVKQRGVRKTEPEVLIINNTDIIKWKVLYLQES